MDNINLKELANLFKLCRKHGVLEIKIGSVELKLTELPQVQDKVQTESQGEGPWADFPTGELTPEQLAFYSSGGDPKDDPDRNN